MSAPLLWEELFALPARTQAAYLTGEGWRRAPDRERWRCVKCGELSKRARSTKDRKCLVCASPAEPVPVLIRTSAKTARRRRRR